MYSVAKTMHENRPGTLVWCMGQTQHSIGNAMVRASCIVQLALGNVGKSGGGANIFRGHDNVQGATDVGPNPDSLPGYYGLAEGSWKHFANTWGVDYEWIKGRYASPAMMTKPGITVSRWIDGVLGEPRPDRPGHQPARRVLLGTRAQLADARAGNEAGHGQAGPAGGGRPVSVGDRGDGRHAGQGRRPSTPTGRSTCCRAATQFETNGSCTASNRSLQWREKVIDPLWRAAPTT